MNIKFLSYHLLPIISILIHQSEAADKYVTPISGCNSCDGSFAKPYDSFYTALNTAQSGDQILLMKGSGNQLIIDFDGPSNKKYDEKKIINNYFSALTIKPAYCTEISQSTNCYAANEKATLYVKYINYKMSVQTLNLMNIILDGSQLPVGEFSEKIIDNYLILSDTTLELSISKVVLQNFLKYQMTNLFACSGQATITLLDTELKQLFFRSGVFTAQNGIHVLTTTNVKISLIKPPDAQLPEAIPQKVLLAYSKIQEMRLTSLIVDGVTFEAGDVLIKNNGTQDVNLSGNLKFQNCIFSSSEEFRSKVFDIDGLNMQDNTQVTFYKNAIGTEFSSDTSGLMNVKSSGQNCKQYFQENTITGNGPGFFIDFTSGYTLMESIIAHKNTFNGKAAFTLISVSSIQQSNTYDINLVNITNNTGNFQILKSSKQTIFQVNLQMYDNSFTSSDLEVTLFEIAAIGTISLKQDLVIERTNFTRVGFAQVTKLTSNANYKLNISNCVIKDLEQYALLDCYQSSTNCVFTFDIYSYKNTFQSTFIKISTGKLTMALANFTSDTFSGDYEPFLDISATMAATDLLVQNSKITNMPFIQAKSLAISMQKLRFLSNTIDSKAEGVFNIDTGAQLSLSSAEFNSITLTQSAMLIKASGNCYLSGGKFQTITLSGQANLIQTSASGVFQTFTVLFSAINSQSSQPILYSNSGSELNLMTSTFQDITLKQANSYLIEGSSSTSNSIINCLFMRIKKQLDIAKPQFWYKGIANNIVMQKSIIQQSTFPFDVAFGTMTITQSKVVNPYYKGQDLRFISSFFERLTITELSFDFEGKNEFDQAVDTPEVTLIQDIESVISFKKTQLYGRKFEFSRIFQMEKTDVVISDCIFSDFKAATKPLYTCLQCQKEVLSNIDFVYTTNPLESTQGSSVDFSNIRITNFQGSLPMNIQYATKVSLSTITIQNYFLEHAIKIFQSLTVNLQKMSFSSLILTKSALYIEAPPKQFTTDVQIYDVNFTNVQNTLTNGGAMTLENFRQGKINITKCNFLQVTSSGFGGSIYIKSLDDVTNKAPDILISNSKFIQNTAKIYGGAIYVQNTPPKIDSQCVFQNNNEEYGQKRPNNIRSHAAKLHVLRFSQLTDYLRDQKTKASTLLLPDYTIPQTTIIENIASGQTLTNTADQLFIVAVDLYNQMVDSDSESIISFSSRSNQLFQSSVNFIKASVGLYRIQNIWFKFEPGSDLELKIYSNGILKYDNLAFPNNQDPSIVQVDIKMRKCKQGEILLSDQSCLSCPSGTYLVNLDANSKGPCQSCDTTTTYCTGGDQLLPKAGHWKLNDTANIIHACLISNACKGYQQKTTGSTGSRALQAQVDSSQYENKGCEKGYTGNQCKACIDGWGKHSDGKRCFDCALNPNIYLQLAVVIIVTLILVGNQIKQTNGGLEDFDVHHPETDLDGVNGVLMRTLTSFLSMTSIVQSIQTRWPSIMSSAGETAKIAESASGDFLSVDCLFGALRGNMPHYYFKSAVFNILPFSVAICAIIFWVIWFIIKKRGLSNPTLKNMIILSVVVVGHKYQPTTADMNFATFQCTNLYRTDKPVQFLEQDLDIQCWQGLHLKYTYYYAVPLLLLWFLLLPGILLVALYQNRKELNTQRVKERYSFLYRGYLANRYYWEFIVMMRKYALILIVTFGQFHSVSMQVYAAMYIIFLSYYIQDKVKPYAILEMNLLEKYTLIATGMINLGGIYFQNIDSVTGLDEAILLLNGVGYGLFFYAFVKLYITSTRKKLQVSLLKKKRKIFMMKKWLFRWIWGEDELYIYQMKLQNGDLEREEKEEKRLAEAKKFKKKLKDKQQKRLPSLVFIKEDEEVDIPPIDDDDAKKAAAQADPNDIEIEIEIENAAQNKDSDEVVCGRGRTDSGYSKSEVCRASPQSQHANFFSTPDEQEEDKNSEEEDDGDKPDECEDNY